MRHMDEVRKRLARARKAAINRLAPLRLVPWIVPRGGFYLWCRLPEGRDSADIARGCLGQKVVLAPGNVFSVAQSAASFLRFNVAQLADHRVFNALQHAMEQRGHG